MSSNNVCQECKKIYSKIPKRCMCGWYFVKPEAPSNNLNLCQYVEDGKQCEELGSVTFRSIGSGWFCGHHAHMLREKSYKK